MLLGDGGAWAEGPPLQGVPSQPPAPLHHHPDSRDPECFSVFLESIRKTGPGGQQAPTGRPSLFLLRPGQSRPPSSAPLPLPGPLNSDQGPPLPAVGPGVSSKRPNGPRALVGTPPDLALPASGVHQLEGCQAASPAQGVASRWGRPAEVCARETLLAGTAVQQNCALLPSPAAPRALAGRLCRG